MTEPQNKKITIVTPTWNSADYAKECFESVLTQTYGNLEYRVMDGDSSDGTETILRDVPTDRKEVIWISERDEGNYDAIRKGFASATGEIITWIDSDNYYLSSTVISQVMNIFNSKEDIDIVVTSCRTKYFGSNENKEVVPPSNITHELLLNKGNQFMPECVFFKKKLYDKVGGLNLDYKLLADYDLWIRMWSTRPNIYRLPIESSMYRVRSDALLRQNLLKPWFESFHIGYKHQRKVFSQIIFIVQFIRALILTPFKKLISRSPRLYTFVIKQFKS